MLNQKKTGDTRNLQHFFPKIQNPRWPLKFLFFRWLSLYLLYFQDLNAYFHISVSIFITANSSIESDLSLRNTHNHLTTGQKLSRKRQNKTNFCLRHTYLYESKIASTKIFFKYPNHRYMKDCLPCLRSKCVLVIARNDKLIQNQTSGA